ncbi:MAG TPA: MG2 domain-containing protein, partial [Burkholderiaceae bacterium]|nr:MG2 domain-containing protein [Burkholderiaceae bacterium]
MMASKRGPATLVVALVIALAAIIGAGWWWQHRTSTSHRDQLLLGSDPSAPFVALECKPRLLDDQPALAVVFSQPLDRKQNLAEAMRVVDLGPLSGAAEQGRESAASAGAPAGSASEGKLLNGAWIVGDNPRLAFFPYIQPQRRFRIEVQKTLRSKDGVVLAEPKFCEVATESMPPSFYFASRGTVLPAGQNGGLPIVTVNVPEVDVQFLRLQPSELPRFFEKVAGARRDAGADNSGSEPGDRDAEGYSENTRLKGVVPGYELDQLRQSSRSVYLNRFVTEETPNKRRVTFIPVETIKELQEPGVYVAVMSQPGRFAGDYQVTYFYVSDIGLHLHRYEKSLEAFATSLKSGKAIGGVRVEVLDDNGRVLAKADADGEGHASFAALPSAASMLVARRAEGSKAEMSVIVLREPALDLSEFDTSGHVSRGTKLFAYAGRDLYRPGESFQVSVLARDADGKPVPPVPVSGTLKRPDGRTVSTEIWHPAEQLPGYLQRGVNLPPDAQTGTWQLELRADPGAKRPDTVWRFQVEEFLPERMKLDLRTDKPVLMPQDAFGVQVQGDYLYGAPAAGNRLLVSAAVERQRLALPSQWPGFVFGDFADDERRKREEVADATLDEQGRTSVSLPLPAPGANSPMLVRGSFSLLESGGRPVVRSIERAVWPAPKLLALRPLFDRDVTSEDGKAEFELVRVDAAGKPQPLKSASIRLLREDRQYYWRFDDQRGWNSGYTETEELIESGSMAIGPERTKLSVPVRYGRYRLEIADPETGRMLRYRFYAGWGAQDAEQLGNRPDRVQLKLAKAPLRAGDIAELTITPPHDGTAIVAVEADRLLWSKRIDVKATGTRLSIPLDSAWARHDLYITATAFRAGSEGDRVTPSRAVGLVHLPLAREDRLLKVALQAPTKLLPERRATVKVKVDGLAGQPAMVTVSAVDAGILNITRYAVPDAFDYFFGKHRYGAELLDMYGKLIEKMEGTLGRLRFGGDSKMRDTKSLPKKVKLVDLFSGPVRLDAKGEAAIALDIPDFNGTLRLMAVAASADRFGKAEAETVVAAPIVAELAMPRFISPGDSTSLALDVTNLSGAEQEIRVRLDGADPVRIREGERSFSLKHQQRVTLRFPVEATDAYGLGRLRLQLTSASGLKIERESVLQ